MSTWLMRWLHWTPRVLGVLYALLLSVFAFDSWEGANSFWEGLAGFLIHLLPVYLLAFALVVGWRWRALGGLLCFGLAIGFTLAFGWREPVTLLLLGLPLLVVGGLFLLDGYLSEVHLRPRY